MEKKQIKKYLFISHATPDDNEFSVWLATKLELCGYKVWIDYNELTPSSDFWLKIDSAIRNDTIKFIFVASKISVTRDGVRKELAVADRMQKEHPGFIIPVRIDDVNFNDFPIEILRFQAIDFKKNWASGLTQLLKHLDDENIPRNNFDIQSKFIVDRWKGIYSTENTSILEKQECYRSNLHDTIYPENIYAYKIEDIKDVFREKHVSYVRVKDIALTFLCSNCVNSYLENRIISDKKQTCELFNDELECVLLGQKIEKPRNLLVFLINKNIQSIFYRRKLIPYHQEADRQSKKVFYFPSSSKFTGRNFKRPKQLSGKYLGKIWHFGLSAYFTDIPYGGVMFKWHLIFTDKNENVLPQGTQIKSRRGKGKKFFNKDWKDLLEAATDYLSNNQDYMVYSSCCCQSEIRVSATPYLFSSDIGYKESKEVTIEAAIEEADD